MDKLVCKEIRIEEIPKAEERHPQGRLGELFARLKKTAPGKALVVECRDSGHASTTLRHIRARALKAAMEIDGKRVGTDCYLWQVAK